MKQMIAKYFTGWLVGLMQIFVKLLSCSLDYFRCVSNSRGGLIKYEFKCPDNTVWDQSVLACNYPYSVRGKCYVAQPGLPSPTEGGKYYFVVIPPRNTVSNEHIVSNTLLHFSMCFHTFD